MISKGFYYSSKIEKNKGDRDFKMSADYIIIILYFNYIIIIL